MKYVSIISLSAILLLGASCNNGEQKQSTTIEQESSAPLLSPKNQSIPDYYALDELDMAIEAYASNNAFLIGALGYYPDYSGPYRMYKSLNQAQLSLRCDSSLLVRASGEMLPYEYCESNSQDLLTQYEFSAGGSGFSTGAGYVERWSKIYLLKEKEASKVFSCALIQPVLAVDANQNELELVRQELISNNLVSRTEEIDYERANQLISTKAYLDILLKSPENQNQLNECDNSFENFRS